MLSELKLEMEFAATFFVGKMNFTMEKRLYNLITNTVIY
jgi:hypothetical protein